MPYEATTRVVILGAGPAGLTLGNLLHARQVPCVVIDKFDREQLVGRTRAGLLEYRTVETIRRLGLADRLLAEGHRHTGCEFRFTDQRTYTDFSELYDGRAHHVYPQQEVVADLLDGLVKAGGDVRLGVAAERLEQTADGVTVHLADGSVIHGDYLAGADGQHGIARASTPAGATTEYEMRHEFQWLTLTAAAAPSAEWTIYAQHERGFAGHLLRSDTVTRFHLQVPVGDTVESWSDDRIWDELRARLAHPGWTLNEGPVLTKNMLDMRSRVAEPMQYGRVFLVGDAAHIISPSGGKGLNLAVADAVELDRVLAEADLAGGDPAALDAYSERRVPDVWKAQEFSHALLHMMHTYEDEAPEAAFRQRLQQSRLWQLATSDAYARSFAASYIGPLPVGG
ncbi:4-hydroxybenzoate 3-monooxygenase [Streptomyces sp. DSM 44915]|uniref:4-hydroxybenzoate 3-monooxygenase n=1 Tax=Streptomyces chisholmiae TaxID=3075540 RepID=A0ABU2JXZ8_9ACTN|nr:4-hydroxybenzoate 3-monooxygenase [Streptomyces sp. DSM 44915]MDT0269840.1 4-hydroxybenzoate 3-monooxygenase [Streptomyces sp. DSM 44915]